MTNAFLDTTVLSDALLGPGDKGKVARAGFKRFDEVLVPSYAIKEFKAGPLRYYVWLHNKASTTETWADAIRAVATVMRQKNLASTAIQAIADFNSSMVKSGLYSIRQDGETAEQAERREALVWLQSRILRAWRGRRRPPFVRVAPLPCYAEVDVRFDDKKNIFINAPMLCTLDNCCLRDQFLSKPVDTAALLNACNILRAKAEMNKRRKVLKNILKHPHSELTDQDCIALGDAVFALQCPAGATVLTTNISDHGPLANAIGKTAEPP